MITALAKVALLGCLAVILGAPGTARAAQIPGGADSVKVRAHAEPAEVPLGEPVTIAVILDHAAGFHSWPHEPVIPPEFEGVMPIATTIEVTSLPEGAVVEGIDWPDPVPVTVRYTRRPVELLSYVDAAVAHIRLRLSSQASPGDASVELRVRYQSCDERICYPPRTVEVVVPLKIVRPQRKAEEISHSTQWMDDRAG
jgi:thiol:disulfide interchange protein DsbD